MNWEAPSVLRRGSSLTAFYETFYKPHLSRDLAQQLSVTN
jgi:hypothetical protein